MWHREAKEGLENELWRRSSTWRVGECAVTLVKRRKGWGMSCDVSKAMEGLENELWRRWSRKAWGMSSGHSPTFMSLHLVTAHFPTFPSLYLRHSSFSIPLRRFTYATGHSPTLPLLDLRHSSFSNPSIALLTSQLIIQPFRCFTYVATHSATLLSLLLRHRLFTYVTWRAAHDI